MSVLSLSVDARGVATVTLTRAEKHNALNSELIGALTEMAAQLAQDAAVRVVVLTGAGKSFCAGGDLAWMQAQMTADAATREGEARALAMMLKAWNELPKPVIARVQGPAYGGGVGLISVCDHAVALDSTKFALTETKLGLIPATIGPYVAAKLGPRTREVFFSSAVFTSADAKALGLLSDVVAEDTLDTATEARVAPYLACAPGAVASAKALARDLSAPITEAQIEASIAALIARWESDEAKEGLEAFFSRRKPSWSKS